MKKIIWCDVETTGLDPDKNQIIEIALLYEQINETTGESIQESRKKLHLYCLPEGEQPNDFDEITKITGITWEYLQEYGISEKELFDQIIIFLDEKIDRYNKEDKAYFIAYNANFDNTFLRNLFKKYNEDKIHFGNFFHHLYLDSLQLALFCEFFGMYDRPENFRLETLAKHLKVVDEDKNNFHSALVDIKTTRILSNHLKEMLIEKGKNERSF